MEPETTVMLQRYATTNSSSRNMLDLDDEFLGGRIAELKSWVKHQKATNDEVKANLVLHHVI